MKSLLRILALTLVLIGVNFMAQATDSYNYEAKGDSIIVNFGNGGRMVIYLKDKDDLEELKAIDLNKVVQEMTVYIDSAKKSESGIIVINNDMGEFKIIVEEEDEDDDDVHITIGGRKGIVITKNGEKVLLKRDNPKTRTYTDLYLGLNSYLEDGQIPDGTLYDLRPLGARYAELAFRRETRIGGENSPIHINYALAFSWYNFMFDGNNQINKVGNQVEFVENTVNNLDKTKLSASYISLPVMLKFKQDKFRFSAGGYIAYRLGSHTKLKYVNSEGDTVKDKDFGNFNLTSFRYGLQTEIGVWGLTIFGKYDLNRLFTSNSGAPELNAFAFGIKL
ncbi:MAG: porin family protein [Flammeovirgaceae bacterium]